jgi:hypothetical protein
MEASSPARVRPPLLSLRWNYCTLFQARVEVDGSIITSQGPATTFEFALELVRKLVGRALFVFLAIQDFSFTLADISVSVTFYS